MSVRLSSLPRPHPAPRLPIATIALGGADPGRAVASPRRCPGVQQAPLHNLQLISRDVLVSLSRGSVPMSPSRAPIGRVEWTRWVAAMACRCGRSTHGDNDAPRSDVQGSTPPPLRRRGACESSQVFQLARLRATRRSRVKASRSGYPAWVRHGDPAGVRLPVRPGPARSATQRPTDLPRSAGPSVLGGAPSKRARALLPQLELTTCPSIPGTASTAPAPPRRRAPRSPFHWQERRYSNVMARLFPAP